MKKARLTCQISHQTWAAPDMNVVVNRSPLLFTTTQTNHTLSYDVYVKSYAGHISHEPHATHCAAQNPPCGSHFQTQMVQKRLQCQRWSLVSVAGDADRLCSQKTTQTPRVPLNSAGRFQVHSESRWILISCWKQLKRHLVNSEVKRRAFRTWHDQFYLLIVTCFADHSQTNMIPIYVFARSLNPRWIMRLAATNWKLFLWN